MQPVDKLRCGCDTQARDLGFERGDARLRAPGEARARTGEPLIGARPDTARLFAGSGGERTHLVFATLDRGERLAFGFQDLGDRDVGLRRQEPAAHAPIVSPAGPRVLSQVNKATPVAVCMGQLVAPARAEKLTGIKSLLLAAAQHEEAMKPLEANIDAVAAALFRRWPSLIGFSVQEAEGGDDELQVSIAMYPEPVNEERGVLLGEIAQALAELMDEAPGAGRLLRARTFARTLH